MDLDLTLMEHQVTSQIKYKGRFIQLLEDLVELPDGKFATREYVNHPGGVVIIPITKSGEIIFEYQYRHPVKQIMLELPAGKIEPNEDNLLSAKRELLEETGAYSNNWTFLGESYPCIGYSNEKLIFYLAKDVEIRKAQLDEGEFITTHQINTNEAFELIYSGHITDGKTIAAMVLYQGFLMGKNKYCPKP